MVCGWRRHEQDNIIAFRREENRVLKTQLKGRRLRLDGSERRRLAELGHRLGRRVLSQVATIATLRHYSSMASRVGGPQVDICAGPQGAPRPAGPPPHAGGSN